MDGILSYPPFVAEIAREPSCRLGRTTTFIFTSFANTMTHRQLSTSDSAMPFIGKAWAWRAAFAVAALAAGPALAGDASLAPARLVELQQSGQAPLLVDVRRTDEYREGHIAGALNIPVEQLAERYTALGVPRDQEIVLYCASGRRAAKARELLEARGYDHVRLLDGSINAWREKQLPLVREGASHP